jgi:hypothetical protein
MTNTIRVRIAVAVDAGGEWNANGWGGRDRPFDPEAMSMARHSVGENAAQYWIEAELPVPGSRAPQGPVTIDGEVSSAGS